MNEISDDFEDFLLERVQTHPCYLINQLDGDNYCSLSSASNPKPNLPNADFIYSKLCDMEECPIYRSHIFNEWLMERANQFGNSLGSLITKLLN